MRHLTVLATVALGAALACAQHSATDQDSESIRVRIAIEIALRRLAEPVESLPVIVKPAAKTYNQAVHEAVESGKNLVVGVGISPPEGREWVSVKVDAPWDEYPEACIVVTRPPVNGELYWLKTMRWTASFDEIFDVIAEFNGRKVRNFRQPLQESLAPRSMPQRADNC